MFLFCFVILISARLQAEDISVIGGDLQKPIAVSSPKIVSWESNGVRVFECVGDVRIIRGENLEILANECVFWFYEDKAFQSDEATIDVYFSGNVSLLKDGKVEKHGQLFLRLQTSTGLVIETGKDGVSLFEEEQSSALYAKASSIKKSVNRDLSSRGRTAEAQVVAIPEEGQAVSILADEVDSWVEGDKRIVTAIGNVSIRKEDMELNADSVVLYFAVKDGKSFNLDEGEFDEMYAEGNVTLRREEDVHLADKVFLNLKKNTGLMVNALLHIDVELDDVKGDKKRGKRKYGRDAEIETEGGDDHTLHAHVRGEEIRLVGEGQYEIINGEFSNCGFGHPHYRFQSSKIRIIKAKDHGVISLAGNRAKWGKRTLFYWPYIAFDIRSKPNVLENWETGNSSRFGNMVSTDWNLFNLGFAEKIDKWSDLNLSLDYLEKRGPGAGLVYDYDTDDVIGKMDAYYIHDKKNQELNRREVEGEDRWRLSWRHRQQLPFDVRMDIEANNLSDDGILREYYENIFKQEKDEETYLYLRRLKDTTTATFLLKKQLNTFDTFVDAAKMDRVAERVPELSYKMIGEPILKDKLNFTSDSSLTYFDRVFSDDITGERPESTVRFDTKNEISAPFQASIVKFRPFASARVVAYNESVENKSSFRRKDDDGSGKTRVIGEVGLDMSTTVWKTYSYYNEFFNINRIRHVFTPEVRYSFNPVITKKPDEINQFDSVDRIDDSQWLLLGFKNKLQTRRKVNGVDRSVDLLYFDVEFNFFLGGTGEGSNSVFDNSIVFNKKRENFIQIDFRAQLTDEISIVSERNEINIANGNVDVFNLGIEVDYDPKWSAFLGQRFIDGISSSVVFSADLRFSDRWGMSFLEQYDFGSERSDENDGSDMGRNLKTQFVFTRYFHEWVGSLTAEFNPVRSETTTRFDIFPKVLKKKEKPSRFWF